jgi:hypothetical protein
MAAWSNVDFNYLCGFSDYTYKGRTFSLMMGIGNEITSVRKRVSEKHGLDDQGLVIPDFSSDEPAFMVTEGDASDAAALDVVTGLHELYKKEGPRLRAAYEAREQAQADRNAYFRKNPPQPKDVTIHFWKRD